MKLLLHVWASIVFSTGIVAFAQSPREQLQEMVARLHRTPNDNPLRERIIKLGAEIKPAPAIPDEAIRLEGRAQFAFKNAKSEADYLDAAHEYEAAVRAAPWVLGYYSDLCTIYEKAGKYVEAKRHCGFYLIGLTDSTQMTEVKRRIAGLEFGIEKANSPQAREAASLSKVNCQWQNGRGSTMITVDYARSSLTYTELPADGHDSPQIVSRANITETNISWSQTETWDQAQHVVSYNLSRISGVLNYSYSNDNGQPITSRRNCVTAKSRF